MTPAAQLGSDGSHKRAPTTTSEPRGSFTTAERNWSYWSRKRANRSVNGPRPRSGPPLTTSRVGSPPVCESTTRTLRTSCSASDLFAVRLSSTWLDSKPEGLWVEGEKCNDGKDLLRELAAVQQRARNAFRFHPYYVYNIQQSSLFTIPECI